MDPLYVIIGASHDIDTRRQSDVDIGLRHKAAEYRERRLMPSNKFQRAAETSPEAVRLGILDENKFGMRVFDNVTSPDIQLARLAQYPAHIAVVGSAAIGKQTRDVAAVVGAYKNDVSIIPVLEQDPPSIARTIERGWLALGKPRKYIFIAGDIPLADLETVIVSYQRCNPDKEGVIADLNARERIFANGNELFDRNYYYHTFHLPVRTAIRSTFNAAISRTKYEMSTPTPHIDAGRYRYKEPNRYVLTDQFQAFDAVDVLYSVRELGKLTKLEKGVEIARRILDARGATWKDLFLNKHAAHFAVEAIPSLLASIRYRQAVPTLGLLRHGLSALFGLPIRTTLDQTDPFGLKDIDAWHDLVYYQRLFAYVAGTTPLNGIDRLVGEVPAQILRDVSQLRESRIEEYPLIAQFDSYFKLRAHELEMREYFSTDGAFAPYPAKDERIPESVRHLEERIAA